jgi:hypothetical protein
MPASNHVDPPLFGLVDPLQVYNVRHVTVILSQSASGENLVWHNFVSIHADKRVKTP